MSSASEQIEKILSIKADYSQAIDGISKYMSVLDELKRKESDLRKQKKDGVLGEQEYQKEMAVTKVKMTEVKEEMKVLTTEVKKKLQADRAEIQQVDLNNASYNKLSQTYAMMTKKINGMTAQQRAANSEYIKQSQAVYGKMKQLQEEMGKAQLNVGNYQGAITGLITGNSRLGASLMNLTGGASTASGAFANIGASVKALGQTLMTLLTNPVFLAIAGIAGAGMAFKWWVDYNNGISEANRLTKEFLASNGINATAKEVSAMRSEIQAMADVYGKNYKETLEGVDALMSHFQITTGEAMDVMNKGFASGADINGDMIAQIKQYAPAFHDAGISASVLVSMIQQTRSGIFSTDGMDLIVKAGKNLRDMTDKTAEALRGVGIDAEKMKQQLASGEITMMQAIQQVSGGLKGVGANTQEAGAVINDVFGKKGVAAGQQQIKALQDINTSLDDVLKTTGEYGEQQQQIVETQQELNQYTEALFGMNGWEEMKQKAELYVKRGLVEVVKWLVKGINYFIDLYNNSMVVRGAVQGVVGTFKIAWSVIKAVFELLAAQVKGFGETLKGLGQMVEGVFTLNWGKVSGGFDTIINGFGKIVKSQAGTLRSFGREFAQTYIDGFNNTVKGAKIEKIKVDTSEAREMRVSGSSSSPSSSSSLGAGKNASSSKSSSRGGGAGKAADGKKISDMMKVEREEVAKAEELLTKLIVDSYERQRNEINNSYDKRISDVRAKLEQEGRLTADAKAALNSQIESLEELRVRDLAKLDTQHFQEEVQREQKRIELKLAVVKKGTEDELELKRQQLEAQKQLDIASLNASTMSEEEKGVEVALISEKYAALKNKLQADYDKKLRDEQMLAMQNDFTERIMTASNNEVEQLRIKVEQAKAVRDTAQQEEGESIEQFNARKLQLEQDFIDAKKALKDKEVEVEQVKFQAIADITGGLSSVMEAFGDEQSAMGKASKILALAEIAVNTGKAIAAGVAQAQSVPFPGNIAAIAMTITAVLANIATAVKTVKSAKFASGGVVTGDGTGTSDSIPVMVSNGESIMTAEATSMFSPLLSAINQLGGGIPITVQGGRQQLGEDFIAAAVAKGYSMAPRPVVSVEEINSVQERVNVIESLSTLR